MTTRRLFSTVVLIISCFCAHKIAEARNSDPSSEDNEPRVLLHTSGFSEAEVNGERVKIKHLEPVFISEVSDSFDAGLSLLEVADVNTTVVPAKFGQLYTNFSVDAGSQIMFVYSYTESNNETTAVRVSAACNLATEDYPVMFVARQQEGILSWQIPLDIGQSYSYWSVSRTLCPVDKTHRKHIAKNQLIYITVSSMSNVTRGFNLSASRVKDFELKHDEPRTFELSAPRPEYVMYTFPKDVSSVMLRVSSPSHTCMTVSVQKIKCPVFDLETNVEFEGVYQTMSTQAFMFLEKADYEKLGGFYLVFTVKPDNKDCEGYLRITKLLPPNRVSDTVKNVTVEIIGTISSSQYYKATFAAVGVFLAFYLVAFIIGVVFTGCGLHKGLDDLTEQERANMRIHINPNFPRASRHPARRGEREGLIPQQGGEDSFLHRTNRPGSYGTVPQSDTENRNRELGAVVNPGELSDSSSNSVDEDNIDFLKDAEEEKEIVRTKTALFVSDLARKTRKKLAKTYSLYHWNLFTIAIFYGLPVVQLVITYQRVLQDTGNQDLCYYNFACAHPLKSYLSSFNNVFSNIGYVLLGILFVLIVYRRNMLHKKVVKKHGELEKLYGIPQHFGLFYAMGLALMMEGFMSACYHVCPNYSNFQFDTSFMYIIACLCMLKIYQARHPDINAKAHVAFFSMALVILIAVLGVVYGQNIFWIFYALIHMLMTLVVSAQVYYMGRWKIDRHIFKRVFLVIISDFKRCNRPVYPNRFAILLFGNIINWAFALYGAIEQPSDFASYLLAIFIGNLLLYCVFYIIMKLLSKERLSWLVILVILTSTVTWGGSLYFFFQHLTSWQLTPAGSRAGNRECILMEFYDHHDVWHFLSAISLFFSFLILLILDDDLSQVRRDRIPVF